MPQTYTYQPLPCKAELAAETSSSDGDSSVEAREQWTGPGPRKQKLRNCVFILAFSSCCLLSFLGGVYFPRNLDKLCFKRTSLFSPVEGDIDITYHTSRFNNTLLQSNIYRDDPSPAVDAAWHDLGISWNNMTIPQQLGLQSAISPGSVRVQDEYGGGFTAMLEVFHQLHCLNLLRKATWYNYDHYMAEGEEEFFDGEPMLKAHVGHCIDMIRLSLMCSADVGVVPFVWVDQRQWMKKKDTRPHRLPVFQNEHKCRNFDAIKSWYAAHQDFRPFNNVSWEKRPSEDLWANYP